MRLTVDLNNTELAYIGLGGNVGDKQAVTNRFIIVINTLSELPQIQLERCSSIYRTAPWGVVDQPDFLNAVIAIRTVLSPQQLLQQLLAIEHEFGRDRDSQPRWGPRTLDLDLLLYGQQKIQTPDLQIPHPRLHQRAFVLVPLAEIAPDLHIADLGNVRQLLAAIDPGERDAIVHWQAIEALAGRSP